MGLKDSPAENRRERWLHDSKLAGTGRRETGFAKDFYEFWPSDGFGACTYTGDLNLSLMHDFDLFESKVKGVIRGELKMQLMQIPHHGSKTSYNKRFCEGLSGACFVNYNSGNNIFDQ